MKKLLHIALGNHNVALWKAFDNNFITKHYNWLPKRSNIQNVNSDIIQVVNNFKPDVVFMQIQNDGIIYPQTARIMSKNAFVINWTGDVRHPLPNWFIELGKLIDVTLFSNMDDVRISRQKGINSDYLQVGFDKNIFTPHGKSIKVPNTVFMGSNYINQFDFPLSDFRFQMIDKLTKVFKDDFQCYGGNWNNLFPNAKMVDNKLESTIYRSTKIAINLSHFNYSRYSSDRILRIMGSGAFCLSHNYKDISSDFIIGKHLETWSTFEELIHKINYFKVNTFERMKIASEGCKFVRDNCTWENRMQELKKIIL